MQRGRPPKLTTAEMHELRRYREAGVSIARLASMWHISTTTVNKILSALQVLLGPEKLPEDKRHLARTHLRRSGNSQQASTGH